MPRRFKKEITTERQFELYNKLRELERTLKHTQEKEKDAFVKWINMEGKYAKGTVPDPYACIGMRGYDYVYADGMKQKEEEERDKFYQENVDTLNAKLKILENQKDEIENQLCLELWGCSLEAYNIKDYIERLEKDKQRFEEQVRNLDEQIEYYKNKLKKTIDKQPKVCYN
jgi:hypothetical protein